GFHWSQIDVGYNKLKDIYRIKNNGKGLWLMGGHKLFVSSNGYDWTEVQMSFPVSYILDIDYNDIINVWAIAGDKDIFATSVDGIHWSLQDIGFPTNTTIRAIGHDSLGSWVIGGKSGQLVILSRE
ncbi:hypothetical protein ACFLWW_03195, partial [Chloroflexota bacterium]